MAERTASSVVVQPMATEKAARELKLWCFQQERLIGCFQSVLHTDIRTVVEALCRESTGRGRPITLSAERTAAVEAALHADGTHPSMAALRSAVVSWRSGTREAADAAGVNRYYDEWRVQGYTQKLEAPQQALCLRCLELSGLHPEAMPGPPLVLDLGCGSGLSTTPLARYALIALRMHTTCTPRAHHVHTTCTRHTHAMHTTCTRHAHCMHTYRMPCPQARLHEPGHGPESRDAARGTAARLRGRAGGHVSAAAATRRRPQHGRRWHSLTRQHGL